MRLTLRTLLAYMDDILEPQDHEELEKRIESSDFANDLIHRTRDTMRRLRLSAPAIKGEGMGLDPNTVAEYLDNTLAADQVADFERVCLESDVHLSEAASCHHVLTMVLGEPAEIDPELRKRMYALPSQGPSTKQLRVAAAPVAASVAAPVAPVVHVATVDMSAVAPAPPVRRVEVPDYLRAAESSFAKRLLPAIAAVLVLSTVAYFSFREGGWLSDKQLAVNNTPAVPDEVDATPPVIEGESEQANPAQPDEAEGGTETVVEVPSMPAGEGTPPVVPETLPPETAPPVVPDSTPAESADGTAVADIPPPLPSPPVVPSTVPLPSERAESAIATPSAVGESAVPLPPVPTAEGATPDSVIPPTEGSETPVPPLPIPPQPEMPVEGATAAEGATTDLPHEELEPKGPPTLGTFSSTRQVLLTHEPDGTWRRLPPRAPIVAGSELLSLPTYRPMVAFAPGINAELVGGTLLKVDAMEDAAEALTPRLTIVYGQVLLINTSMAELAVPLQVGEVAATARLKPNATLAIEAQRLFQPGADAAKAPAPVLAVLFAPAGGVVWESPGTKLEVTNPGMWPLAGDSVGPVDEYTTTPWIDGEPLSFWAQMSSPAIERLITNDQPVATQLLGLYENTKRKEEKALLTECSMHVGQFVPFVRSLKDPNQAPEWDKQIEALRMAMARSPELAQEVLDTLIEQQGEEKAPDLYQLLCGFSAAQIGTTPEEQQSGALKQLIDWLESDQLDYRVLAFYNLKSITGKQLSYSPAGNEEARTRAVRVWRLRLKDNELIPTP